jgi:hypothetical protein
VDGTNSPGSVSAVPSFEGGVQVPVTGVFSELMECCRSGAVSMPVSFESVAGDETRL